jgi:hypothetical protein
MAIATQQGTLRVRVPTVDQPRGTCVGRRRLARSIAGARVGLRTEGDWASWLLILDVWESLLRRDGAEPVRIVAPVQRVGAEGAAVGERVAEWAAAVDCGVSGLGTCGSCTAVSVVDAVTLADHDKPAVIAVTEEFEAHARRLATYMDHPDLELVVFPHPLQGRPEAALRAVATQHYPQFLDRLGAR